MAIDITNISTVVTAGYGWITTTAELFTTTCLAIPFGLMVSRKAISIAVGAVKSMMHG
ncbi:TPA: hypothetical protein HA338_08885 [Methanosarcina acetivorans]|uniref:Uncharacterized protein n=1 Tax=Methanosarcina acetivorans TaxID=2214 RepID=A0A832W8K1_9EURY|nr:hypothetical protein [Methanosarcina acetivorans]HIH94143.1 hypothetical protein [Methanosarcina acetivorans]